MDTVALQKKLSDFAKERDWEAYHTPKNLAAALSVEASELLEIFQWLSEAESLAIHKNPEKKKHLEEEMADVILYLLRLADICDVDIEKAAEHKLAMNEKKYPVSLAKGNATKYDQR